MFSPFRGLRFDPAVVPDVGAATSPPYDVVGSDDRRRLMASSEYNMAHVLLPTPGDETYQRAAGRLMEWRRRGALVADAAPQYYLYEIDYVDLAGTRRTARGVLGALDVVELGDRVLPHEETMAKHRADRLAVMTATGANLDVIIALASDPGFSTLLECAGPPRLDFEAPDGTHHRLYDMESDGQIAAVTAAAERGSISIADGHHRYVTAQSYRAQRDAVEGPGPWGAILTFLAPTSGSGLTIGPWHRTFEHANVEEDTLRSAFDVTTVGVDATPAPGELLLLRAGQASRRLVPKADALASLPAPWRRAAAAIAREVLYPLLGVTEEAASYIGDVARLRSWVDEHPDGLGIQVAPVTEAAIAEASEAGLRFPQKTTYFLPKPRAGLVVRAFDV